MLSLICHKKHQIEQMGKAPKWGVNTYHKETKRKRPGRHKKNLNKSQKRMRKRKYRGQGRP